MEKVTTAHYIVSDVYGTVREEVSTGFWKVMPMGRDDVSKVTLNSYRRNCSLSFNDCGYQTHNMR